LNSGAAEDLTGGGLWCESASAVASNCVLIGNSAFSTGGGAFSGTLKRCSLLNNTSIQGGGVSGSTLNNCVLTGNAARFGGGALSAALYNCSLAGNWGVVKGSGSGRGGGAYQSTLYNSIIYFNLNTGFTPSDCDSCVLNYCCAPPDNGSPTITDDPLFVDQPGGNLRLQSNSPCINAGHNGYASAELDLDGNPRIAGGTVDLGAYEVQISNSTNYLTHYVNLLGANPTEPYTNWSTAALRIQDAIDTADNGDHVLVTNGVYQAGGSVVFGVMSNRVAVTKRLAVESVNGPAVTVISGNQEPGTLNGDTAVRCVYLTYGATLSGFTLTNGATRDTGDAFKEQSGGGIYCESTAAVSNCVISGNSAAVFGGGAYQGALDNCTLGFNAAAEAGGGIRSASAFNSLLLGNHAHFSGGGASESTLNNCTIISNWVFSPPGTVMPMNIFPGGGASGGTLRNCIVYYNYANDHPNCDNATVNYCCTTPDTGGAGNVTDPPLFADPGANFRLATNSPCINSGDGGFIPGATDLDGRPRVVGGGIDIGAYEFQSEALSWFNAWLQLYGLPTDGSADYSDADADGMNNWQEWSAGTLPNDSQSVLRLLSPTVNLSSVTLHWQSVPNRNYLVQRANSLNPVTGFSNIATHIPGQPGSTVFTDTNAPTSHCFYRVGVE
jgi:hypothetical protein